MQKTFADDVTEEANVFALRNKSGVVGMNAGGKMPPLRFRDFRK